MDLHKGMSWISGFLHRFAQDNDLYDANSGEKGK